MLLILRQVLIVTLILFIMGIFFPSSAGAEAEKDENLIQSKNIPGENTEEVEDKEIYEEMIKEMDLDSLAGWEDVERHWFEMEDEMEEYMPSWEIENIWREEGFPLDLTEVFRGLINFLFSEVIANLALMGKLLLLAVSASLLKNLQYTFKGQEVSDLTEKVVFFIMLALALGSFTLAVENGREAIESMVVFMKALIPVLLTLLASLGHVTSASLFHPVIVFAVNVIASIINNIILPLIFFTTILYMVNHISPSFKVSHIAGLLKDITTWSLGIILTLFTGFTAIQGVAGGIGDALTLRTAKYLSGTFIPVVGKMMADAVEMVFGYSMLLKNSATIGGLIILAFMVFLPLLKILALVLIYRFCAALIQPLGETSLGEALNDMGNCLILVFAAVATVALTFFIAVAIIAGASNAVMMLR